jgi:hypothetical protein
MKAQVHSRLESVSWVLEDSYSEKTLKVTFLQQAGPLLECLLLEERQWKLCQPKKWPPKLNHPSANWRTLTNFRLNQKLPDRSTLQEGSRIIQLMTILSTSVKTRPTWARTNLVLCQPRFPSVQFQWLATKTPEIFRLGDHLVVDQGKVLLPTQATLNVQWKKWKSLKLVVKVCQIRGRHLPTLIDSVWYNDRAR